MKKAIEINKADLPKQDAEMIEATRAIEKESHEDRGDFYRMIKQGYAHMIGNKEFLKSGGAKPGQSDRFIPIVWQYVNNVLAIITSQEVYPKYVMKLHQAENVQQAELANAIFAASRERARWDEVIDNAFMTMLLASGCVVGPYVDKVDDHPNQIVTLRSFSPLQYHCTRGRSFNYAPERLLTFYLDKSELIAIYPQFLHKIEELRPVSQEGDEGESGGGGHGTSRLSIFDNLPTQDGKENYISKNAIKVTEFYMRDFGFRKISEEEDSNTAYDENDEFLSSIEVEADHYPNIEKMIEVYHRHPRHIQIHKDQIQLIEARTWEPSRHETVFRVIELLKEHIEEHKQFAQKVPNEKLGHVYNYERGWHYCIVLNGRLMVENGNHPYLGYEIHNPPLREITMEVDPFHERPIPFAYQFCDLAGGLMSAYNMTEDILKARLPKVVVKKGTTTTRNLSSAPDEILEIEGAGSLQDAIMVLQQASPSPAVFGYIKETKESIEEGSGIFAPMKGKPGGNVRSSKQVERLQDAGLIITDSRMNRVKPHLKWIATWMAMMNRKILPPPDVMTPILRGIAKNVSAKEWEEITDIGFAIEVVMKPGDRRISDERRRAVLEIAPVLKQLVPEIMAAGPIILRGIGEIFKDEIPELAKMAEDIAVAQEQQMQQAMEQAQQEAMMAGPGNQGQTGPPQRPGGASLPTR